MAAHAHNPNIEKAEAARPWKLAGQLASQEGRHLGSVTPAPDIQAFPLPPNKKALGLEYSSVLECLPSMCSDWALTSSILTTKAKRSKC